MEISYLLLIITCFIYGATPLIQAWDSFALKIINVLFILAVIVLVIITGEDGFFSDTDEWYWIDYVLPVGAVWLGGALGKEVLYEVFDYDDDWFLVFTVLAGLGLVATIITTCCGV